MAKKQKQADGLGASILVMVLLVLLIGMMVLLITQRPKYENGPASDRDDPEHALTGPDAEQLPEEDPLPRSPYVNANYLQVDGRIIYDDAEWTSRAGIDVSAWQEEIDWEAVREDGIDYAILQLGYRSYSDGALVEDKWFRENLEGAKAAGLDVGVYFFSQAISVDEATEEAEYVLDVLDGADLDLPVFYDWESIDYDTARTDGIPGELITACAKSFCETVERNGYEAGIYFNQNYVYYVIDLGELLDYPLWLAQYSTTPDMRYDFAYWQYTDEGYVDGIDIKVDLNIQYIKKGSESLPNTSNR